MGDAGKLSHNSSIVADMKTLVPVMTTGRRTKAFAYGFVIAFVACTAFLAFSPSGNASSPWFNSLFTPSSSSSSSPISTSYRSHFDSIYSYFFPNSSAPSPEILLKPQSPDNQSQVRGGSAENGAGPQKDGFLEGNDRRTVGARTGGNAVSGKNRTEEEVGSPGNGDSVKQMAEEGGGAKKDEVLVRMNETRSGVSPPSQAEKAVGSGGNDVPAKKQTIGRNGSVGAAASAGKNQSVSAVPVVGSTNNGTSPAPKDQKGKETSSKGNGVPVNNQKNQTAQGEKQSGSLAPSEHKPALGREDRLSNFTASLVKGNGSVVPASRSNGGKREDSIDKMMSCDIFHGHWVRDDSYPLYPEGSCPHIDEPFDCYHNGRPDRVYQKLRWQPHGCNIPRLNATDMLERLRGKRLVFVGDSLNRNMWESLVCVLRHAVKDKKKVFEASGKREFRTQGSYSFLFKDYDCTVEFFRSPFLVQEWEMDSNNGTKKDTLRLDIVERSASKYKDAYIIVFNTGHWWTHEKTSKGKDYYQEGNRIYSELNVDDAFHKALNTWAKWVDANVNSKRTHIFFRGYSASHFSGGQWNSGGQCDKETEPIKNEAYLTSYPPMMSILESVINEMKTPVTYLNITRMTDYRKDAHPSIYRKPNMTEEEKAPDQIQDCSHWCLPGVPDSWNELVYAQLLIKQHQMHH